MKGTPYAPWASRSGTDENSESKCVFWQPFSTPMTLRLNYHERHGVQTLLLRCVLDKFNALETAQGTHSNRMKHTVWLRAWVLHDACGFPV